MTENRHKTMTFKGVLSRRQSLEDVLSALNIGSYVPDDEFAADMQLLVSGKMSPEEHRAYLKEKYSSHAA